MKEMFEHYYYIRDGENRPIITVCLLKTGECTARGIAICSDLDNPCKSIGRSVAKGRATKALIAEKSSCCIHRHFVILKWKILNEHNIDIHKATYNPVLTEFERKLLNKSTQKYEQQNLPGFLVSKGRFLYGQDGALRGIACDIPQSNDKIKIQIETDPLAGILYAKNDVIFNLRNENKELRDQLIQLEKDQAVRIHQINNWDDGNSIKFDNRGI